MNRHPIAKLRTASVADILQNENAFVFLCLGRMTLLSGPLSFAPSVRLNEEHRSMSLMSDTKIRTKILSVIVPLCLAALGSVFAISSSYRDADGTYSEFILKDGVASVTLARLNTQIVAAAYEASRIVNYPPGDPSRETAMTSLAASRSAIPQMLTDLKVLVPDMEPETTVFEKQAVAILATINGAIDLAKQGKPEDARAKLSSADDPIAAFRTIVRTKINDMLKRLKDQNEDMSADMQTTIMTYAVSLTILFAALIAGAVFIASRGIVGPINALRLRIGSLADGDTQSPITGLGRRDEVGQMAEAVAVFRDNAIAARRIEEDAAETRSLSDEERQRSAAADRLRAEEMTQATKGLGEGLKHLAGGDLTFHLAVPFAPSFEVLRTDFNAAVEQLSETLRAVTDATGSIDNGSREVSASADDLSKRTEQQAAALEETAAALDEITVNVTNSSKRAEEARKVAIQANDSAAQSGRVVADAVDAMQKIEQSSNQVSNIIGVIDEIAFQTNLLALNAGVEAARAGEAGKGFAVVAQEVRELAQRSAQAAKEIKDLIRNSSVEVRNGVKLVSDTGAALKTIESYIVTVNQHMDAIATSAREQSVGLAEVNTAVNQMDQVTQQNAAMVEETSAAGATLANDSSRLRDLIGRFQLVGSRQPGAATARAGTGKGTGTVAAAPRHPTSPVVQGARKPARIAAGNTALKETWEEF
jgi:methyl-accepting chemotaxis protein